MFSRKHGVTKDRLGKVVGISDTYTVTEKKTGEVPSNNEGEEIRASHPNPMYAFLGIEEDAPSEKKTG